MRLGHLDAFVLDDALTVSAQLSRVMAKDALLYTFDASAAPQRQGHYHMSAGSRLEKRSTTPSRTRARHSKDAEERERISWSVYNPRAQRATAQQGVIIERPFACTIELAQVERVLFSPLGTRTL